MRTTVVFVALALGACAPALKSAKPGVQVGARPGTSTSRSGGASGDASGVSHVELEPLKIEAVKTPDGNRVDAYDAASLFEQAGADLEAQRYDEAIRGYDRLVTSFPDSRYVVAAYYNAGLALEGKQDFRGAAARYRAIVDKHPQSKDALDALFRMGACYAEINNWAASAEAFGHLLERSDLALGDHVEALARRGLAQHQLKDLPAAERSFREALNVYHANEATERLDNDFFVAMSQFYLGEIAHEAFRALPLRLPQKQLAKDLEAKAESLLTTQTRYVDTARIKNPAWATAAGHQIAALYKEFYDAMLAAPMPPELKTDELKKIYFDELRQKIEPLLRKAIHAHELTLGVAERFGIENDWVRKSNEEMAQLRALLNPNEKLTPASTTPAPPAAGPAQPASTTPTKAPGTPDNDATPHPTRTRPGDEYHPRVVL